ncbi:primosomal protein [Leptospira alexanderi]|uniref:primosomal protein n=1 Tax=Leptospira alexanderi TaxID=100053 RepID=UPI0009910591|nr:primosomal protein [Leptospira alexanderi]
MGSNGQGLLKLGILVTGIKESKTQIDDFSSHIKVFTTTIKPVGAAINAALAVDQRVAKASTTTIKELEDSLKKLQTGFDNRAIGGESFNRLGRAVEAVRSKIEEARKASQKFQPIEPQIARLSINTLAGLEARLEKFKTGLNSSTIGSDSFNRLRSSIELTRKKIDEASGSAQKFVSITAMAGSIIGGYSVFAGLEKIKSLMDTAEKASMTMKGLSTVVRYNFGEEAVKPATDNVEKLSKDLNLQKDSVTAAARNFIAMGYSVEQATNLIKAHANVGSVLRQQNYSLSEAIDVASQGYKNQNSVLSDATGIQTNISKMLERHGFKMEDLSNATKKQAALQALYNETLKEAEPFEGKAAELTEGYSGSLGKLGKESEKAQIALGKLYQESITPLLNVGGSFMSSIAGFLGDSDEAKKLSSELDELREKIKKAPEGSEEWKKLNEQITKSQSDLDKLGWTVNSAGKSLIVATTAGLGFYAALITITKGLELMGIEGAKAWTKALGPIALGITAVVFTIDIVERYKKEGEEKDLAEKRKRLKEVIGEDVQNVETVLNDIGNKIGLGYSLGEKQAEDFRKKLQQLGFTAEETQEIIKKQWYNNKSYVNEEEINKWRKALQELNKEAEKPKANGPLVNFGGSRGLKQDLSEQKRIIEEFWRANPAEIRIISTIEAQSFEYLKKQLIDFSQRKGGEIPLKLNGKDISIDQIKDKETLQKVVNELSQKYQIHPDVVLKLKPENITEFDELMKSTKTELDRKLKDGEITSDEHIALKTRLDSAKAFDDAAGNLSRLKSELQASTGPLTQLESGTFEFAEQLNRAQNNSQGLAYTISAWAKTGISVVNQVGGAFTQLFQAQAQATQVHVQNQAQRWQFQGQVVDRMIDANLQNFLSARDSELAKLQDTLDKMAQAEKEYEDQKQARRDEAAEKIKAENDARYNEEALALEAKHNAEIAEFERIHKDDADFKTIQVELFNRLQQEKDELRRRWTDKTTADIAKENKNQDAEDAKRTKENEKKQKAIADQEKAIETEKVAATQKAETDKQNAKRFTSFLEWQAGKTAFEANKRAQVAAAAMTMSMAILQGVAAWATLTATTGPLGLVGGAVFLGMITALSAATGAMAISSAQSQQYPPWMGFSKGGLAEGGISGKDSIPALLTPKEIVVPERGWDSLEGTIAEKLTQNVTNRSGTYNFNYQPEFHGSNGNYQDPRVLFEMFKDWLYSQSVAESVLG